MRIFKTLLIICLSWLMVKVKSKVIVHYYRHLSIHIMFTTTSCFANSIAIDHVSISLVYTQPYDELIELLVGLHFLCKKIREIWHRYVLKEIKRAMFRCYMRLNSNMSIPQKGDSQLRLSLRKTNKNKNKKNEKKKERKKC